MNPNCKKPKYGQLNNVDRLSNLPDFIIYRIFSLLDSRQRYRTSILSKRWARLSATTPFLEFHYYCKAKNLNPRYWPSKEASARLLDYIDTRMQRYNKEKLRVTTLRLIFPNCNEVFGCNVEEFELSRKFEELSCKVDEWILIAVRNQVARLDLYCPINYQLPEILLSAKSLRGFAARNVKIPYYNKAISIAPLQALALFECVVEERMLNHIISSCVLLKYLSVNNCSGLKTIVIPGCSRLKGLELIESLPKNGTIILGTSNLTCFKFCDSRFYDHWPILSKLPSLLRNLRVLDIVCPGITDENLGKRLPEFASLEILRLSHCDELKIFKISSIQLKKIYLIDCSSLLDVTIDAQSLTKFKFKGILETNLVIAISSQPSCDISVDITPDSLDTVGFFKSKKLMTGLGSCNILKIALNDDADPVFYTCKFF
ncbi:F-box/LRR-repeat protein At3g58900-like [Silene latifolia]|uniref:F-box/LRR-repeat protein At3g58900-like n=1 Tax=Silene latifolia TaxID=37657 RepID=UPI003D7809A2